MADGSTSDRLAQVDPAAFASPEAEVTRLRLQMAESVRTQGLVIVDETGVARARLGATPDGGCRLVLLDEDGFERIGLAAERGVGVLDLSGRSGSEHPSRVRMYAHDPADGDGCAVGLHLVVQGNAAAGLEAVEGRSTHVWT
ncbi:MAG TPA: hypothetical protein VFU19_14865 [Iamia sp.]|nr:hypothetical protein [Iamia sp.]